MRIGLFRRMCGISEMGTYSDSKIVTARKLHSCGECGAQISKGQRYLNYKPGLRSSWPRCMKCATEIKQYSSGGRPIYDCAAVRAELGLPADTTRVG